MILLNTAIFETRQYLVAAFAFGLACAVFRYWLLKVSNVIYRHEATERPSRDLSLSYISCMLDEEILAT